MAIAYLISAYTDPEQLARLLAALASDRAAAFVHLDRRVDIDAYRRRLGASPLPCEFISDRVEVAWGGFSQVRYQHNLLRRALAASDDFQRFVLLSAADYPLWPRRRLEDHLLARADVEFLTVANITRLDDPDLNWRVTRRHYRDLGPVCPRPLRRYAAAGATRLARLAPQRPNFYREAGEKRDIYLASGYMCLSRAAATHVVACFRANHPAVRMLKTAFVPEEFVIPTLVMNSQHGRGAAEYPAHHGLISVSRTHFFLYIPGMIKTLSDDDFDEVARSGKMFARKFTSQASVGLARRIDQVLRNGDGGGTYS